jgi:hypothetical protein
MPAIESWLRPCPGHLTGLPAPRVLFWTLFLLPLNELFKQSLGFFGRFFSRSS